MAYNREKTLAIVTGIVCALIFCAGTALGGIHAITTIGALGILAVACYLIGDIAIAWAAFIDYQEDGNAMEWTAWAVKYILSAYLLFSGGCIAYMLFTSGETQTSRTATAGRATQAQKDCLDNAKAANGGKLPRGAQTQCTEVYKAQLGAESTADNKTESQRIKWVDDFVAFPLFNYIPGILGLAGLFFLTLVSKLSKGSAGQSGQSHNYSPGQSGNYSPGQSATFGQSSRRAPFRAPSSGAKLQAVTNGNGFFISFAANGGGQSVRFRERGSNAKHVVWVTQADAEGLALLPYDSLAKEVMKRREARHGQDSLYKQIAQSVP